ncbi:VapE domain-containing protein [Emticicia sp. 17c]|uniref:VapE domain-containing protein n=1 Tax=Emticicia sp. 17c TaxID=3127704 RepID=UPI00301CC37F
MSKRKKTDRTKLENWLRGHYKFRMNMVNHMIEYTEDASKPYRFMLEWDFNNIIRKIECDTDFSIGRNQLEIILKSDFIEQYHPIRNYFDGLEKRYTWPYKNTEDIKDLEIYHLADTLKLNESNNKDINIGTLFCEFLRNWMTASVANSMTDYGCQNQMCLVLIGGEGLKKSGWLMQLTPPELIDYSKTSKIDLSKIDIWLDMGRIFIFNIDDQLKNLQKKDSETMKTIITQPHDLKRLPHASFNTFIPRIANFCGSINGREFLSDTGKNRRYFPFEVLDIDYEKLAKIDINLCWFEAVQLYKMGVKYWYDVDELAKFDTNSYRVVRDEEELFYEFFEPVLDENNIPPNAQYKTAMQILRHLQVYAKKTLSIKFLGELLTHIKCVNKKKNYGNGRVERPYLVIEKFVDIHEQKSLLTAKPVSLPNTLPPAKINF